VLRFLWLSMSVGQFYDLAFAWDTLVAVASEVFPVFIDRVWRLYEGLRQIEIDVQNRVMTWIFEQYRSVFPVPPSNNVCRPIPERTSLGQLRAWQHLWK